MNNEVIKSGLAKMTADKLDGMRVTASVYTPEMVDTVLTAALQSIEDVVADGDTLILNGFMTIEPKMWKARKGRNVCTGEVVEIPARIRLKFKPGKRLRDACGKLQEKDGGKDET